MSYHSAIDQLYALTPELHTQPGEVRRKFSLAEFSVLLAALDDPHRAVPAVLIAGTNGKGSTAATLASILTASGLRVGLYTSPHLERVNERIRINGAEIADEDFARCYFTVRETAERLHAAGALPQLPSFFEFLTALAFVYFREQRIDFSVLEVGMGGRLDATNVVDPLLSIITDISLDHTEWLGSTIAAIAREKAGILRKNGTLVTLPQHPEANQALGEVAVALNVRGVSATAYMPPMGTSASYWVEALGAHIEVHSPLTGQHQQRNLALAIAAAVELATSHHLPIKPESVSAGIRLTQWPGRLERLVRDGVTWILDVAHNPAGAWALRAGLAKHESTSPRTLVFSCLSDKPVTELAQILFPFFESVLLAPLHTARAASLDALLAAARRSGSDALCTASVREALQTAKARCQNGVVVVSGSVYLVGEARSILLSKDVI